jgi:hypothetical protein
MRKDRSAGSKLGGLAVNRAPSSFKARKSRFSSSLEPFITGTRWFPPAAKIDWMVLGSTLPSTDGTRLPTSLP